MQWRNNKYEINISLINLSNNTMKVMFTKYEKNVSEKLL